jgi:hypothetical protein
MCRSRGATRLGPGAFGLVCLAAIVTFGCDGQRGVTAGPEITAEQVRAGVSPTTSRLAPPAEAAVQLPSVAARVGQAAPGARELSSTRPGAGSWVLPLGGLALPQAPPLSWTPSPLAVVPTQIVRQAPAAPSTRRHVSIGGAAVSGGSVRNAARVVAGFRTDFRDCYARGPSGGSGALRFTVAVGERGAVTNVSVQRRGGLSPAVIACATARVQQAKFDAPDGGSATIQVPATFFIEGRAVDRTESRTPDERERRRGGTSL